MRAQGPLCQNQPNRAVVGYISPLGGFSIKRQRIAGQESNLGRPLLGVPDLTARILSYIVSCNFALYSDLKDWFQLALSGKLVDCVCHI